MTLLISVTFHYQENPRAALTEQNTGICEAELTCSKAWHATYNTTQCQSTHLAVQDELDTSAVKTILKYVMYLLDYFEHQTHSMRLNCNTNIGHLASVNR